MAQLRYRPEIDGLRAVAVVPVVLFHAGVGWLPGGFLGVDIFFVISGYLITRLLLRDLQSGTYSIRHFYARRARRILPALLVVVLTSCGLAGMLMDAAQLEAFGRSLMAQAAFAGNILFWRENGYFAEPSDLLPLLHTWSLAVEEQFYLVFPLVLAAFWRKQRALVAVVVLAIVSLAAAHYFRHTDAAFYLLPFRAWELLAGAAAAMLPAPTEGRRTEILSVLGLVLIAVSMLWFRATTPHPGLNTLPLILGACLVVRYAHAGAAHRLLATPLLVGIGLISYSLYLWHWPLLAFTRLYNLGDLPNAGAAWALAAAVALSYLTWRFVETPARDRTRVGRWPFAFSTASMSFAAVAFGGAAILFSGLPGRLNYPSGLEASFDREPTMGECVDNVGAHVKTDHWFCELGPRRTGPIAFVVTGDSHAYAALPAFRALAAKENVRAIAISDSGCPPLLGIEPVRNDQAETNCRLLNERVYEFAKREHALTVVLVARWTYYSYFGQAIRDVKTGDVPQAPAARMAVMRDALARTVGAYAEAGVKVAILGQVPEQRHFPRTVYRAAYLPHWGAGAANVLTRLQEGSVSRAAHDTLQTSLRAMLKSTSAQFIDPTPALCDDRTCLVGSPATSYYSDIDHLSVAGAEILYAHALADVDLIARLRVTRRD